MHGHTIRPAGEHDALEGGEALSKVTVVDQSPRLTRRLSELKNINN